MSHTPRSCCRLPPSQPPDDEEPAERDAVGFPLASRDRPLAGAADPADDEPEPEPEPEPDGFAATGATGAESELPPEKVEPDEPTGSGGAAVPPPATPAPLPAVTGATPAPAPLELTGAVTGGWTTRPFGPGTSNTAWKGTVPVGTKAMSNAMALASS